MHTSPTRAPQIALAVVLGGIELHVTKDTWRNPTGTAAAYFVQLVEWGYGLVDVEQIVTDAAKAAATIRTAADEATSEQPEEQRATRPHRLALTGGAVRDDPIP